MQYFNYPDDKRFRPVGIHEGIQIRKVFSNTAWMLICCEIMINIIAICLYLIMSFGFGYENRYDTDGNMIITPQLVIYGMVSVTISLILMSLIVCELQKKRLRDILGMKNVTLHGVLLTVFISLGAAQISYIISMVSSSVIYMAGYEYDPGIAEADTTAGWVMDIISSVILAPVFEELFYRGVIMRSLTRVSKRFAIFVSAVIFGLVHGNPYQFMLGFICGVIFAYADIKMNSIIPSIIAHIAVNAHTYIGYSYAHLPVETQNLLEFGIMVFFIVSGVIAVIIGLKKYGFEMPEYNEYHKKRTLPILIKSVPAWIYLVYAVGSVFGSLTPIE